MNGQKVITVDVYAAASSCIVHVNACTCLDHSSVEVTAGVIM